MQNNRFSRIKTRRRNVNFNSYNSGIIERLKNKRFQRQTAMVTALFLFFQILSPFGVYIKNAFAATTAPVITSANFIETGGAPACSDTSMKKNININADLIISFDQRISGTDLASHFSLKEYDSDNIVPASVTWNDVITDPINMQVKIDPASDLVNSKHYYVYIDSTLEAYENRLLFDNTCNKNSLDFVTKPSVTIENISRTTDTEATFGIKSSSTVTNCYYKVYDTQQSPYPAAAVIQSAATGTETSCGTASASQSLVSLASGVKYIYAFAALDSDATAQSLVVEATLPAYDSTAPVLTAGAVNRTSDTAGTVKFTSNEAGNYFYYIAADGASVPTIDTSGNGTTCTTSETTIVLAGLTAGAKDVYVRVKDAAGNLSLNTFKIDVAEYTADTTAPTLTSGAVNRSSDTAGTVKFTSSEAGNYYYSIVTDGANKPIIDSSGAGTSCTADETTIALANLTAGAKDVYVIVKDAAGNISADTFKIDLAAFVADTTAPSITPGTVTRTSASAGTVVFTSNEAGKYYFLVAGDGDTAPMVNQIIGGMTGVNYNTGTVTVNISGLASGAKDIYFILEDSVPNRTVATKFDMPAYVNPDTCPSCEIKGTDDTVNKNGATINFPDNPSNLGDGFNIAVTQNAASSRTAPTNKTIQNIYDITPSKSLTGTYSATITLAYPSGQTYKSGDTVMYWDINSNTWSSSGISGITGSGGNISFSTNHFTEFAIITDALASNNGGTNNGTGSTTGTGGTTVGGILPTAGSTILNMFLNFMLAIGGYVLIQRYLKKSRYGAFVN